MYDKRHISFKANLSMATALLDTYKHLNQLAQKGETVQLAQAMLKIENWNEFRTTLDTAWGTKKQIAPLHMANKAGHLECVKLFENIASASDWNDVFETAFDYNHTDILNYVLPKVQPQFLEDWSCARAVRNSLHAVKIVLPHLSDHGKRVLAYYAASHHHTSILDFLVPHTDVNEVLEWMLAEENIKSDEHEQWLRDTQNQLQNQRISQHVSTQNTRTSRKI